MTAAAAAADPGRSSQTRALWHGGDHGGATIEFISLVVGLLLPVLYLVLTLARLQAGLFAVETAAREAARVHVTADAGLGADRAPAAAAMAFADHGFDGQGSVAISCSRACDAPDADVTARASLDVALPFLPVGPASITVVSSHTETVDRFREGT